MPYHDIRRPAELERADYAVLGEHWPNSVRCAPGYCRHPRLHRLGWKRRATRSSGILGTSLGSCYAFIASAHDPRLKVNAFNHASTYLRRCGLDRPIHTTHTRGDRRRDLARIPAAVLAGDQPYGVFNKYARWPKKSLIVYAKYDLTFLPQFSEQVVEEFERWDLNHRVAILPCGHYTTGETLYKFMDAWHIGPICAQRVSIIHGARTRMSAPHNQMQIPRRLRGH